MHTRRTMVIQAGAFASAGFAASCTPTNPEKAREGTDAILAGASQFLLGLAGANIQWLPASQMTAIANIVAGAGAITAGAKQLIDAFMQAGASPTIRAGEFKAAALASREKAISAVCRPNETKKPIVGPLRVVWTPMDGGPPIIGRALNVVWEPGELLPVTTEDLAQLRLNRFYDSKVEVFERKPSAPETFSHADNLLGPSFGITHGSLLNDFVQMVNADRNERLIQALGPGQAIYRDGVATI